MQVGIVGLPNVGKSTLFNALMQKAIALAANYPFATIEPNTGSVAVPDARLQVLERIVQPERVLPAMVEFVDIAGLVAGAASGEGLGNQFLAHIRQVDAIAMVLRFFTDGDVIHVSGKVDAGSDKGVVETELALADLDTVQKRKEKTSKLVRSGQSKEAAAEMAVLERLETALMQGVQVRGILGEFAEGELEVIRTLHLLTAKPVLYVANVEETALATADPAALAAAAGLTDGPTVVVSARLEEQLLALEGEERAAYLAEMGVAEESLPRVARAAYALLGLQSYFTAGEKEVRAWTVKKGSTAPQAAGVIHTDFEEKFIRAEVVAYDDFVANNGWAGARTAGKARLEGKTYIMQDGDVCVWKI